MTHQYFWKKDQRGNLTVIRKTTFSDGTVEWMMIGSELEFHDIDTDSIICEILPPRDVTANYREEKTHETQ